MFPKTLSLAARFLIRRPGFSVIAVLVLALGIGGFVTIFTLVKATLLHPLPHPDSDRLIVVKSEDLSNRKAIPVSYADFLDWRLESRSYERLVAFAKAPLTLRGVGQSEYLDGELVSAGYFELLGARPHIGRFFSPDDNEKGAALVTVLSKNLWRTRFGSDEGVLGTPLDLSGHLYTVIGVGPEGFGGFSGDAVIWAPMAAIDKVAPRFAALDLLGMRAVRWHQVIGRLQPGTDLEVAQSEMNAISGRLAEAYPDSNQDRGIRLQRAEEAVTQSFRPRLYMLLGAAGFVLLVACANLSSLLLSQFEARRRELALRLAIGARGSQIVRQLLIEGTLLAIAGGMVGLLLAFFGKSSIVALLPVDLPAFISVDLDFSVLAFTLGLALLTGLLFSLLPAVQVLKVDLVSALKQGAHQIRLWRFRYGLQKLLVTVEVSVVVVLVLGAGLMIKSLWNLTRTELGFDPESLLTFNADFSGLGATDEERAVLARETTERLAKVPGIDGVTSSSYLFFTGKWLNHGIEVEGQATVAEDELQSAYRHAVAPDFFSVLGIPLLQGRAFNWQDAADSIKVAVVSRVFADRHFPTGEVIGRRFRDSTKPDGSWLTVVGVVGDVQHKSLLDLAVDDPDYYVPIQQYGIHAAGFLLRTNVNPAGMAQSVRNAIGKVNVNITLSGFATMKDRLRKQGAEMRSTSAVISIFAALTLVLALTGVYGIISRSAASRRKELAVRASLGAGNRKLYSMLLSENLTLVAVGLAVGLTVFLIGSGIMSGIVFNVDVNDPGTLFAVSVLVVVVSMGISLVPTKRAVTQSDFVRALREE